MSPRKQMIVGGFLAVVALAVIYVNLSSSVPKDGKALPAFTTDVVGTAPWSMPLAPRPDDIRFAIIGDRGGLSRPGVFNQAMKQIDWLKPEFVLSVGDLIEGEVEDAATVEAEWKQVEAEVANLRVPFFYVPGNHDLNTPVTVEAWKQKRGPSYYHFIYKNVLFVVLNTEDPAMPMALEGAQVYREELATLVASGEEAFHNLHNTRVAAERATAAIDGRPRPAEYAGSTNEAKFSKDQIAYVKKVLDENRNVRWTFFLMHKPAWKTDGNFAEVEPLFAGRNYTVVAGHYHSFDHTVREGHDYFTMATTGGIGTTDGPGKMDHIAWVTVGDKEPSVAVIKLNGLLDSSGKSGQTSAY